MTSLRIISLIASSTEIICELGLGEMLVGRSHECDYPPWVKQLPQCTRAKFNVDGTSHEIDQAVKAIVKQALSVYDVDVQMLEDLSPTHIVTQSQCDVCAVSLSDVEQALCKMVNSAPKIITLEPNCLEDIWNDILQVSDNLDIGERGLVLVGKLKNRIQTISNQAKLLPNKPTVACIEWIDPLMAAGNWMPELVTLAGGISLFGVAGKHSPKILWKQLLATQPDVVIVCPCGFDIERTKKEIDILQNLPGWTDLRATKNKRVYIVDGNQYFNRPGPRVVESLEIIAEILHTDQFSFGHKQVAWQNI